MSLNANSPPNPKRTFPAKRGVAPARHPVIALAALGAVAVAPMDDGPVVLLDLPDLALRSLAVRAETGEVWNGDSGGVIRRHRLSDGACVGSCEPHAGPIADLVIAPSGRVASGAEDGTVHIYESDGTRSFMLLDDAAFDPQPFLDPASAFWQTSQGASTTAARRA